jgi:hypothetical protein
VKSGSGDNNSNKNKNNQWKHSIYRGYIIFDAIAIVVVDDNYLVPDQKKDSHILI